MKLRHPYLMKPHPVMDWCRIQRLINKLGPNDEYPHFPIDPLWEGDRLSQYGFDCGKYPAPEQPGVYAVTATKMGMNEEGFYQIGSEHLLYIGSSLNIAARVNHPDHYYRRLSERLIAVTTRHLVTEDYRVIEKSLIRTLRPPLNIQHNR